MWSDFVKDVILLAIVIYFILEKVITGTLNELLGLLIVILLCVGMISRGIYSELLE